MSYLVLRGSWQEVDLAQIKKGESFKVLLPRPADPSLDNNPIGEDVYVAKADAYQTTTGDWAIDIEKPSQLRWSTDYLNDLAKNGISIQVKGISVREETSFRNVTG